MTKEERAKIAYEAYREELLDLHVANFAPWASLERWNKEVWHHVIDAIDAAAKGE